MMIFSCVTMYFIPAPLNSWKRLIEGVTLWSNGVDPYSGAVFHETPIALAFFSTLLKYLSPLAIAGIFVVADLLAAFLLGKLARQIRGILIAEQGN